MAKRKSNVAQSEPVDNDFIEEEADTDREPVYLTPPPDDFFTVPALPQGPMARLNINTSIPVENLARLASPAPESAPAPAPAPVATATPAPEPNAADRYLEDVKRENKLRAYIYRMPDRLPLFGLPERLPKDRRGWVHYGSLPFNPDEFESEIQATFPPGNYWVDIREGGQFRSKEIVSVAANPLQQADQPNPAPPQAQGQPQVMPAFYPAPPELPTGNPEKQVKALLEVAKQLLSLQPAAPPVPTLAERLEELKLLQKMLTPPPPPPPANPLEELVKVVESEAFGRVKKLLRNPDNAPAESSGWQSLLKEALPYLLPALAPLTQALAVNAARNLQAQQRAAAPVTPQPPAPAAQSQPQPPQPLPAPNPAPPAPAPAATVETETESEGETMQTLTPLQQLVADLAYNRAPSEVANDITQAISGDLLATMQLKMMVKMTNAEIWELITKEGVPQAALEQIAWRDEWLDSLRESLKTHFA